MTLPRRLTGRLSAHEEEAVRPVRHPGDLIRVTAGALILAASAAAAGRGTVGRFEADLFRLINDLPSMLTVPLMVVMQAGSLAAGFIAPGLPPFAPSPAGQPGRLAPGLVAHRPPAWPPRQGVQTLLRS